VGESLDEVGERATDVRTITKLPVRIFAPTFDRIIIESHAGMIPVSDGKLLCACYVLKFFFFYAYDLEMTLPEMHSNREVGKVRGFVEFTLGVNEHWRECVVAWLVST
jgi:hypothetical protein